MPGGRLWSDAEDKYLTREYPHASLDSISAVLGRSSSSIHQRAWNLGLSRKNPRDWPESDVEFLRRNYPTMPTGEIVEHLGRPDYAIWSMARRLGISKERCGFRYAVNSEAFDPLTPDSAYVVGMILADGCIHSKKSFSIDNTDREILELISKVLGSPRPLSMYHRPPYKPSYKLGITDAGMVAALSNLGIGPRKSLTARLPQVPPELFFDLLRGYFDGDGNAYGDGQRLRITLASGSPELLADIAEAIARHLGTRVRPTRRHANHRAHLLTYHGLVALEIADHMYRRAGQLYMKRKREPFEAYRRTPHVSHQWNRRASPSSPQPGDPPPLADGKPSTL